MNSFGNLYNLLNCWKLRAVHMVLVWAELSKTLYRIS